MTVNFWSSFPVLKIVFPRLSRSHQVNYYHLQSFKSHDCLFGFYKITMEVNGYCHKLFGGKNLYTYQWSLFSHIAWPEHQKVVSDFPSSSPQILSLVSTSEDFLKLPSPNGNTAIASKCIPVSHHCSSWVLCPYTWKSKQKGSVESQSTTFMSNWTKSSSKGQNLVPFREDIRSSLCHWDKN